jgi:hypothetical protein
VAGASVVVAVAFARFARRCIAIASADIGSFTDAVTAAMLEE